MPGIFISYRRSDTQDATGRIYDRLVARFSQREVFIDVDNIPLGVSFPMHIKQMLTKAYVVLVIIGPTWTTVEDEQGVRRLDDENDFVRMEVELALRANMPVIPVLVSGAKMPTAAELPPAIQSLVTRNGIVVRHFPDFNNDIARLFAGIEQLERLLHPLVKSPKEPAAEPIVITVADVPPHVILIPKKSGPDRSHHEGNPVAQPFRKKSAPRSSTKPERTPRQTGFALRFLFCLVAGACSGLLVAGVCYLIELFLIRVNVRAGFLELSLEVFSTEFAQACRNGARAGLFGGMGCAFLPRIARHPITLGMVWMALFCGIALLWPELLPMPFPLHEVDLAPSENRTLLIAAGYGALFGGMLGLYARMLENDRTHFLSLLGLLVVFALIGFLMYGAGVHFKKVRRTGAPSRGIPLACMARHSLGGLPSDAKVTGRVHDGLSEEATIEGETVLARPANGGSRGAAAHLVPFGDFR